MSTFLWGCGPRLLVFFSVKVVCSPLKRPRIGTKAIPTQRALTQGRWIAALHVGTPRSLKSAERGELKELVVIWMLKNERGFAFTYSLKAQLSNFFWFVFPLKMTQTKKSKLFY